MGLTLQFAVGNEIDMIRSVKSVDFDFLDKLEQDGLLADFSLHIEPRDLDMLVRCACAVKKMPEMTLRENLDFETTYVDEPEYGATLVSNRIVSLFASFDESNAQALSEAWFYEISEAYPLEDIKLTNEATQAVRMLITISKRAQQHNSAMMHFWSL